MSGFNSRYARVSALAEAAGVSPESIILPAEGMVAGSDGTQLHYLEWPGPIRDPMLLLLHGGGLHAHTFDVAGLLLRDVGRCIALDLRGHGESEWAGPHGYGSHVVADDIETAVSALDGRRVVVIAHSLSGIASLLWASRRPQNLAGLIIVDVGPDIDKGASRSIGGLIAGAASFANLEEAENFLLGRVGSSRDTITSGVPLTLTWTDDRRLTWKHDPAQFRSEAGRIAGPEDLRRAAADIVCPTLVLRGARSPVLSDAGAASLAGLIPKGRWQRVPDAGHTIQSSNPRGLAHAVSAFLSEHGLLAESDDVPRGDH
jgi:esterase